MSASPLPRTACTDTARVELPKRSRPDRFWLGTIAALARDVLLTVPWATLLAGCATGTVLLAVLAGTSRTALDQNTVRLTFLPAVAALVFVPRAPSQALAQTAPLPTWVIPVCQTLLAAPAVAMTCSVQLVIMTTTIPGTRHPPAIYPLIAQLTGWCAIGVAVAAACGRSRYADLSGALAAPLALAAIALAWVTPGLKDVLALPPAASRTATIAWYVLATGALAVAVAGMGDRWHRYTRLASAHEPETGSTAARTDRCPPVTITAHVPMKERTEWPLSRPRPPNPRFKARRASSLARRRGEP